MAHTTIMALTSPNSALCPKTSNTSPTNSHDRRRSNIRAEDLYRIGDKPLIQIFAGIGNPQP